MMKSIYPLILSLVFLFDVSPLLAQIICGDQNLTSQQDVNECKCNRIEGNLTISGADITTLNPIFNQGMNNGAVVTGSVTVTSCPALVNLDGLDGIGVIGDWFNISNNASLSILSNFGYQVTDIGGRLNFQNCPNLANISVLSFLKNVKGIYLDQGLSITDLSVFNNLLTCDFLQVSNTSISEINGFNSIPSMGYFYAINLPNLHTISGFNSVTEIKQLSFGAGTSNFFGIASNNQLKTISGFSNLSVADGTDIFIGNNTSLEICCFATEMLVSNPGNLTIGNNAIGCNSFAQVNAAPTLSACPPNTTISTSTGNCFGNTTFICPTALDNCDLDTYFYDALGGQGEVINNQTISSGQSVNFNFSLGLNSITFKAIDLNNNLTTCIMNITVVDDVKPTISNIPADVTINCNDPFPSPPQPLISDNCDGSPALTETSSISTGPCGNGEIVEVQEYTWMATDLNGNTQSKSWKVTRLSDFSFDLGPPVTACSGGSHVITAGNIGSTYSWSTGAQTQAISVSNSGTYAVTITTANGCCFVDQIDINFGSPPNAVATGAALSCTASSVQIMGSSATSGVSYSWTGPGGFTSLLQNPEVTNIGNYTLTVTSAEGCTAMASAMVTSDTDVPDASATVNGVLDCTTSSVGINGSSTTNNVTYAWMGPSGFTSAMQNPTVTAPGTYTLTVASANGCSITAAVEVEQDITTPVLELADGVLNCTNTEINYSVEGSANWSGPSGFTSSDNTIMVNTSGSYNVTVTGGNGCTSSASFTITEDINLPDISAEGGMVTCASPGDTLRGFSTTPNVSFFWSGPNGYTASFANPFAVAIGTYTLTVTGLNGCTSNIDVELSSSVDAPVLEASGGAIDCINETTLLTVSGSEENLEYVWTGPNGFSELGSEVSTSTPGTYTVTGTNSEGCAGNATIEVADNSDAPVVQIFAENLNCTDGETTFSTAIVSGDVVTYEWSGPESFASSEKEPAVIEPGEYTLVATAENGCSVTLTFNLQSDVSAPDAMATGGTITCTENSVMLTGNSSFVDVTFLWEGPDGFSSTLQNPSVSVIGTYKLNVFADNGCSAIDSVEVEGDPDLPTISAIGGVINCLNESVTLLGSTSSEGVTTLWTGPNGFETSTLTPVVDIQGLYTFTVTSAGNCQVFSTVEVFLDIRSPDLLLSQGPVNCELGSRTFNVSTNVVNGTFEWNGPNGFVSEVLTPPYQDAGTYTLVVTGDNGCSSEGVIEVASDVNYESNLIITGNDVTVEITGGTAPFSIIYNNSIVSASATDLSDGEHFVSIRDGLGCEQTFNFTIMTTSTNDIDFAKEIKLYPNPVTDQLKLEWTTVQLNQISIVNAAGQYMFTQKVIGQSMVVNEVSSLAPGIYFVKLEGAEITEFKKFLKL